MSTSPARFIPMQGCVNFRDLGGYRTREGRTVKWRRLFRSDALQELTEGDAAYGVEELALTTIVDLRNTDEMRRDGVGPWPEMGVAYHHFPLLDERGIPPIAGHDVAERLTTTYLWAIRNSGKLIAEAVDTVASAEGRGAVFHCSAGKDRTGIVAALILEVLGVDGETAAQDYLLTNEIIDRLVERIHKMDPSSSATAESIRAQPIAFEKFQTALNSEFGGAEEYLRSHGLSGEALQSLRATLLD